MLSVPLRFDGGSASIATSPGHCIADASRLASSPTGSAASTPTASASRAELPRGSACGAFQAPLLLSAHSADAAAGAEESTVRMGRQNRSWMEPRRPQGCHLRCHNSRRWRNDSWGMCSECEENFGKSMSILQPRQQLYGLYLKPRLYITGKKSWEKQLQNTCGFESNPRVVTVVVIVALIRPVVVDVEVEMESACGKPGHSTRECPSEEAEEVVMRGAMTGMEVEVVDTMVLIEMVVDLAGAIEIVVLKEDHEMTAIIRTVLVPMDVVVQETSVQGRKNSPDRTIEDTAVTCWRCQSLFCCISSSWFSRWTNLLYQTVDVRSLAKRFNFLMSVNARFDVLDPMTLLALLKQSNLALLFQCYDEYWISFAYML